MKPSSGLITAVIFFAAMMLAVGLAAVLRCPPQQISSVIQAFGSWLHIGIQVKL